MKNQGFTLIELIIYLAITSAFAVSLILWSLSVGDLGARARAGAEVNASARFALEILTRDLEQASAVTTPVSNIIGPALVFVDNLNQTITTALVDGQLMRTISGSDPLALTAASTFQITDFTVERLASVWSARDSVAINLTLVAPPAPPRTLSTVINLRH